MLQPGSIIKNRYRVLLVMNSGGMGQIYKIQDQDLGNRICVLKELIIANFLPQDRQVVITSFQREAALLARLNHPNLPRATDYFMENGNFYLVVDYIEGENLEEIRQGRRCSEEEVIRWSLSILDILEYLHNQQPPIIYRDLKPANIMLDVNGNIKLVDFGIAREFDPTFTNDQTHIGTCGYAPPEQYRGKAEPRSDLYALGVVMHYLLTGLDPQPFNLQPIETIVKDVSGQLAMIVNTATDLRLNYRYSSSSAMKQAIGVLTNNQQSVAIFQNYNDVIIQNLEWIYREENNDNYKEKLIKAINYFKNNFFDQCINELLQLRYSPYGSDKKQDLTLKYSLALICTQVECWLELEGVLLLLIKYHPDFAVAYEMLATYQVYIEQEKAEQAENKRKKIEMDIENNKRILAEKQKKEEEILQKKKEAWENRKTQFFSFFTRFLKK